MPHSSLKHRLVRPGLAALFSIPLGVVGAFGIGENTGNTKIALAFAVAGVPLIVTAAMALFDFLTAPPPLKSAARRALVRMPTHLVVGATAVTAAIATLRWLLG